MTTIELDGLSKAYGSTVALDGVSVTVEDGEFFTLVGPSGCGKTTTLRLIAGFEQPTAGSVRFDGEDVSGSPPEDRGIGVVFQNYALFPHMSVGENVAYGLRFVEPPNDLTVDERVSELLELVGLAGMAERDPDTLSGGQRQRVALARALAPGPRLLLLDEPMSALDAQLRERLRRQVREIQSELGVTTVYVTHDQEEALSVSDRVAVMNEGRIEQIGTPRDVYRRPTSEFVARFVGDNNVFAGAVTEISRSGGETKGVTVSVDGTEFELRSSDRVDLGGSTGSVDRGDRLAFCVRPEQLRIDSDRTSALPNAMEATVADAEFLGEQTRVHLDWNGQELLARTSDPLSGTVELGFDPGDARIVSVSRE